VVERSTVNRLVVGSSPTWGAYNEFKTYIIIKNMSFKINRIFWKFFYSLGNLQLAITLLLIISVFSSVGTIIEQEKSTDFYELNYPINSPLFGFLSSKLILFLGLNHIYTTTWFLVLLATFGISLFSCTLSRQIPSLKMAKLWRFFKTQKNIRNNGMTFVVSGVSLNHFSYLLRKKDYNVIQQNEYVYAYKGLIGKIGPILVHLSIIFILLGSITGFLSGFIVQEIVPKHEIFHLQNVISAGPLSFIRNDFEGYIKDFKIAYSEEGIIDQFYSDIEILDDQMFYQTNKVIFVNEPLKYEGITFYQTDWGISCLELTINGSNKINVPLNQISLTNNSRFWLGILENNKKILIILQDLTGKYLLYNSEKMFLGTGEIGQKIYINGDELRITKIIPETGMQIKSDPGIYLVYFGFLGLIFSVFFSYISYVQIWAIKKNNQLWIYGNTNRAIYFFEKNILSILDTLKSESIRLLNTSLDQN
jgi:cytochrome c biogenesis protein